MKIKYYSPKNKTYLSSILALLLIFLFACEKSEKINKVSSPVSQTKNKNNLRAFIIQPNEMADISTLPKDIKTYICNSLKIFGSNKKQINQLMTHLDKSAKEASRIIRKNFGGSVNSIKHLIYQNIAQPSTKTTTIIGRRKWISFVLL